MSGEVGVKEEREGGGRGMLTDGDGDWGGRE